MDGTKWVVVFASVAGLSLGAASPVWAAGEQQEGTGSGLVGPYLEQEPQAMAPFSELDQNGDERISLEEAQANDWLYSHWNEADINSDGELDQAEFAAFDLSADPRRTENPAKAGEEPSDSGESE